jgi:hypothetical protein
MSAIPQTSGWQAGFLTMLPAVQTHAKIKFRKLRAEQREEKFRKPLPRPARTINSHPHRGNFMPFTPALQRITAGS